MRVINAQPGPRPLFLAGSEGFGFTFPNPITGHLLGQLFFRISVKEIPFQIVLAHVVFAEPKVFIQNIRRFWRPILA